MWIFLIQNISQNQRGNQWILSSDQIEQDIL